MGALKARRVFVREIAHRRGVGFELRFDGHMVFATIYRSVVTRFLAAFIVVLVLSPYSEPFATIDGTDFGGLGAVDVGDAGKSKATDQDVLAGASTAFVLTDVFIVLDRPITRSLARDARQVRLAILRL